MWLAWRRGATLVPAPRALVRAGAELGPWLAERRVVGRLHRPDSRRDVGPGRAALGPPPDPGRRGVPRAARPAPGGRTGGVEHLRPDGGHGGEHGRPPRARPDRDDRLAAARVGGRDRRRAGARRPARRAGRAGDRRGRASPATSIRCSTPSGSRRWRLLPPSGPTGPATSFGRRSTASSSSDAATTRSSSAGAGSSSARSRHSCAPRPAWTPLPPPCRGRRRVIPCSSATSPGPPIRPSCGPSSPRRLPAGIVPTIVALDALPAGTSGKVDRRSLPWAPPAEEANSSLSGTMAWLAKLWADQLGPVAIAPDSDFFDLGGSSLAAALLVSALRDTHPAAAIADVYEHRTLERLAARLEELGAAGGRHDPGARHGVCALRAAPAPRAARPRGHLRRTVGAGDAGLRQSRPRRAASRAVGVADRRLVPARQPPGPHGDVRDRSPRAPAGPHGPAVTPATPGSPAASGSSSASPR